MSDISNPSTDEDGDERHPKRRRDSVAAIIGESGHGEGHHDGDHEETELEVLLLEGHDLKSSAHIHSYARGCQLSYLVFQGLSDLIVSMLGQAPSKRQP